MSALYIFFTSTAVVQTAYHGEFEKAKGKYTQIADDPELLRVLKNQETVSMVLPHGPVFVQRLVLVSLLEFGCSCV